MIFGFLIVFTIIICVVAGIWEHWPEKRDGNE